MRILLDTKLCLGIVLCLTMSSCYSHRKAVEGSLPNSEKISWPGDYAPEKASFFVHNEIEINAPPQAVWDILIQAEAWPAWYKGAKDVKITNNATGRLESESVFSWKTMGQDFKLY